MVEVKSQLLQVVLQPSCALGNTDVYAYANI